MSTKPKHTPGPWKICYGHTFLSIQNRGALGYLATVPFTDNNKFEALADARLIAVAPEMLQALKHLLSRIESTQDTDYTGWRANNAKDVEKIVTEVRLAVQKAEGRDK